MNHPITTAPASPAITRRHLLAGAAAGTVAASAAVVGWTEPVAAAPAEAPHERVHRLALELSHALGDPEWQGFKRANVTPTYAMFDDPDMPRPKQFVAKAIADHRRAHAAFCGCCDAADSLSPRYEGPKAEARWRRLERAEDRALEAAAADYPWPARGERHAELDRRRDREAMR